MVDDVFNGKRFGSVVWGYDRAQVDEFMGDYAKWGADLTSELEKARSELGRSARQVRSLEAKVSKLELRAGDVPPDSVRSFAGRLDEIVGEAWDAGRTLRERSASEVASDQDEAEANARDMIESAEAQASRIGADAAQDRAQAAQELETARQRADRMLIESESAANERAQRVWEDAQPRLHEVQDEIDRLEEQRLRALEELTRLRGSLERLEGMVEVA